MGGIGFALCALLVGSVCALHDDWEPLMLGLLATPVVVILGAGIGACFSLVDERRARLFCDALYHAVCLGTACFISGMAIALRFGSPPATVIMVSFIGFAAGIAVYAGIRKLLAY